MDDFLNKLDLGDPDPTNHRTNFDGVEDLLIGSLKKNPMIGGATSTPISKEEVEVLIINVKS